PATAAAVVLDIVTLTTASPEHGNSSRCKLPRCCGARPNKQLSQWLLQVTAFFQTAAVLA
ncbi:hypothetical protein, partial [Mesorhizobium sp.]|uniref:hypothetical protein n=1 Tax=Mesorhizobium sp. TaxID=1871066 RepID=UPI0025C52D5C